MTRGDSWVPDLAVHESPAFRAKATKYEKMVSHGSEEDTEREGMKRQGKGWEGKRISQVTGERNTGKGKGRDEKESW